MARRKGDALALSSVTKSPHKTHVLGGLSFSKEQALGEGERKSTREGKKVKAVCLPTCLQIRTTCAVLVLNRTWSSKEEGNRREIRKKRKKIMSRKPGAVSKTTKKKANKKRTVGLVGALPEKRV